MSDLFCGETCQNRWQAQLSEPLPSRHSSLLGLITAVQAGIEAHEANRRVQAHWETFVTSMRADMAALAEAIVPVWEAMKPVLSAASENMLKAFADLERAGLVEKPLPVEPQARALALRKRRNTGPHQQQRAPRAINPRSAR